MTLQSGLPDSVDDEELLVLESTLDDVSFAAFFSAVLKHPKARVNSSSVSSRATASHDLLEPAWFCAARLSSSGLHLMAGIAWFAASVISSF
jgi:hypothetical protein